MAPFKSIAGRNLGKLVKSYLTSNIGGTISGAGGATGTIVATGGNKYTPGNGFIYHAFINSMNTSPDAVFVQTAGGDTINVLIVAGGGGGGGGYYAGGGGAGGILEGTVSNHQPGTYNVTAGAGGDGGIGLNGTATNGGDSSFGSVTALGGGRGGSGPGTNDSGGDGGSGGGSSYYVSPGVGSALTQPAPDEYTPYGNGGGISRTPGTVGGGGGGAGAAGSGITGGNGQAFPVWSSSVIPILTPLNPVMGASNNTYGGGGGGAPSGAGGVGGGGSPSARAGADYLGGGGAGSASPTVPGTGGAGGDGIVLIRYRE